VRQSTRRSAFRVESLEGKTLLSGLTISTGAGVPHAAIVNSLQANAATPILFAGTVHGFYTSDAHIPDTGVGYTIVGAGRLAGLGRVLATGSLHSLGFIQTGHASGTLMLGTARGSLSLTLTGATQPGFAALPTHFDYTISGGTGRFRGASGRGAVDVTLQPATSPTPTMGHGKITLVFNE
jgi:hypothetical protein